MTDPQKEAALTELFRQAGAAHHEAFAASDGEDPEWPLWYADWLQQRIEDATGMVFTRSLLVHCLVTAEEAHKARDPEGDWAAFYAHRFLEHHAASDTPAEDVLTLYHQPICPYCRRVQKVMDRLGLDQIQLRNIWTDPGARDDLVAARGRQTVPVLHIQAPDGDERWMPESADIIHYLEDNYG